MKYEADPMGFVHTFNAYEDDSYIILDAPWQSFPIQYHVGTISDLTGTPDQLREYMLETGPISGMSTRFVLPLKAPAYTGQINQINSLGKKSIIFRWPSQLCFWNLLESFGYMGIATS